MTIKRLFRRIRWLLIYQWNSLTLKQWPCESCKKCGKIFRIMWDVQDKYWEGVFNEPDANGVFCIDCFIELAEQQNIKIPEIAFTLKGIIMKEEK